MHAEWKRNQFLISTDPARLNVDAVHGYLSRAYWCEGIPREIVERALHHSLCFGLYDDGKQIGLARAITDYTTFAYLCDVYVLESHRGQGLGKWLISCVMALPQLQGLRRFNLVTRDAHQLLKASPLNFIGNVEAREVYKGSADVIVCDGFTGNVALKASEGLVDTVERLLSEELSRTFSGRVGSLLSRRAFRRFRRRRSRRSGGG